MQYIKTLCIGLVMGACDIVPGVSGGTIAFISGIYEKLLVSIRACTQRDTRKLLLRGDIVQVWNRVDGSFLLVLFVGIGVSILFFSQFLHRFLETDPHLVWGFFAGLVIASIVLLTKQQKNRTTQQIVALVVGASFAYALIQLSPTQVFPHWWIIILAAAIAVCAMILPGVSGSFLLLIMGMYGHVITALKGGDVLFLSLFFAGMVVGLGSFVRVASYMFKKYHDTTVAVLVGFMIGALPKLRPRQNVVSTTLDRHGEELVLETQRVLPAMYQGQSDVWFVVILFVLGSMGTVFLLSFLNKR